LTRMASRCGRAPASRGNVRRSTGGRGMANIVGFSCTRRRRPAPGGRAGRGWQILSDFSGRPAQFRSTGPFQRGVRFRPWGARICFSFAGIGPDLS
jgi:hypothetical protein